MTDPTAPRELAYDDAIAQMDRLRAEVERLNKWADSFSNSQLEERRTGEQYQRELRAEVERLRAALETAAKRFDYIAAAAPREIASPVTGAAEARASAEQQKNERMSAAVEAAAARKRAYYETHDPPHCPTCGCGR